MRSVFNDTSQSHASFITHLLRLCSFLTFPCINSNFSFFTNCVSLHIYCSMSPRRPVIALLLLGLCMFYPVWALPLPWARVSESIRLKESRVILKMQAIQRESHHISVFSVCCIAISGAQRLMWVDGIKVLLCKFESLFVILFWRFHIIKVSQTVNMPREKPTIFKPRTC